MQDHARKYVIFLIIILLPLAGYAADEAITQPHKPPILTTTAIIEVYDAENFKGIVLIERGKAPFGKAIPGGKARNMANLLRTPLGGK